MICQNEGNISKSSLGLNHSLKTVCLEREAPPRLGGGFQVCKLERKLLYSLVALIIDIYLADIVLISKGRNI